jgi:N-acetylmuramoyl-L-alanine amidase
MSEVFESIHFDAVPLQGSTFFNSTDNAHHGNSRRKVQRGPGSVCTPGKLDAMFKHL